MEDEFVPATQEEIDAVELTPEQETRIPKTLRRVMIRFQVHLANRRLEDREPVEAVVSDMIDGILRALG